jgi:hypothetical protein
VLATLRDRLRSGDVWVERSSGYRRFDSYPLPADAVPAAAAELGLPATADEWLAARGAELDRRLRRFARRLKRGELEGVEFREGRLHVARCGASAPPEALALAGAVEALMPAARITEVLHDVARATGFAAAFTNLRTGERCEDESALLAAVLADATNLGLGRMAAASHGVTRDRLVWTADAYIRPETYRAALARIIDAHHALPIAAAWGDGTTSSSDRQFSRSARRGDAAGEVNARYGPDPGLGFYTHVSGQHGPTARASCRRPATRRRTCWTGCCTTARRCGSARTSSTRAAPRTTCSSCAPCWASASARACATSPTAGSPPLSRPPPAANLPR